jgi:hypothetical protein
MSGIFSKDKMESRLPPTVVYENEPTRIRKMAGMDSVVLYNKDHAVGYGKWLIENCLIIKEGFNYKGPISNEQAYELYLESLKNNV